MWTAPSLQRQPIISSFVFRYHGDQSFSVYWQLANRDR